MGRKSKVHSPTPPIREHLAENVRLLRDRLFHDRASETERNKALAARAATSLSQVQRIVTGKSGVSIDALESFARALECRPQDLVTPYFAYQGVVQHRTIRSRPVLDQEAFLTDAQVDLLLYSKAPRPNFV